MNFDPNILFYEMVRIYKDNSNKEDKVTICNEGSTRSSKTWDFFHFLVMYCENNKNKELEIYILRETLADCKDYTFKEFQKCLKIIGIWDDNNYKNPQKPYYNLYGNNVFFRGLDDSSEGYPSDIYFVNEALENQKKEKIEGIDMRCRRLAVMDWNPKYTDHWCFDLEGQSNVHFTHSNYKNNKHLEQAIINKIESYCPWNLEDLELKEKDRRPNYDNIEKGTSDKYRWLVYGEGIRSAPEGLIFQNVEWIDEFPDIDYWYGLDFGFTNDPTSLVRFTMRGKNIYLEPLLYQPIDNPLLLHEILVSLGIEKYKPIVADSSDRYASDRGAVEMVKDLKAYNWSISKVSKRKTLVHWINKMKEYKINIVKNELYRDIKKEQENYKWREVSGKQVNIPVDAFNHFWDASRYALINGLKESVQIMY